jgi:uncharacterized membrane protein YgcG
MLRYARSCVGKPFSTSGMARSLVWPRKTDGKSFFCAGTLLHFRTRYAAASTLLRFHLPIVFCILARRRISRRGASARRSHRQTLQPRRGDSREPTPAIQIARYCHCEPLPFTSGQRSTAHHYRLGRVQGECRDGSGSGSGSGSGGGASRSAFHGGSFREIHVPGIV